MENKAVCFIFMGNLYLCPYITKYLEHIDYPFDIIYWNRDGIKEDIRARNVYSFEYELNNTNHKFEKLKGYWYFKKYATKILKENSYDGVIVLQTIAGILLHEVLRKQYFNKFILDIRDYTLEKNKIFYYIEKKVIKASAFTVISSEGFKKFLPEFEYVILHNNRMLDKTMVSKIKKRSKLTNKLVIAFIGFISYQEQHKKLLKIFKNDERFELYFIGKDAEKLIPFCKENDINNVKIEGKFLPQNILYFYENVNIINNLYGNNTPILDYALSNKLYFAAELRMPILVCEKTFMEEISKKYDLGYTVNFNDPEICNKIYNYYHNIGWKVFEQNCDLFLQKVNDENKNFETKVKKFIKGERND
ncbi:hypothetical protein [Clostridium sp. UBA871]|uniref:hypothetical protein n=1 Tax=Clostridium sp. UBA871 TaxID=1946380 RepID=UPI0032167143